MEKDIFRAFNSEYILCIDVSPTFNKAWHNGLGKVSDFLRSPQSIDFNKVSIKYLFHTSGYTNRIYTPIFTDDTSFLGNHDSPHVVLPYLQDHLFNLEKWSKKWKIKAKEQKYDGKA